MKQQSDPKKLNGTVIVIVLLVGGCIMAFALSRLIPSRNPRDVDPGNPYYSPPSERELEEMKKDLQKK